MEHPPEVGLEEVRDTGELWPVIVRWTLVMVVLAAAGFGFYECSRIAVIEAHIEATFGGKPLPAATQWVFQYHFLFIMLAAFVPCAALATFALRERSQAFGALVALILLAALHAAFIHLALFVPYTSTIKTFAPPSHRTPAAP